MQQWSAINEANFLNHIFVNQKVHQYYFLLCNTVGRLLLFFHFDCLSVIVNRLNWFEVRSIKFKRNESVILCPLSEKKRKFGLLTDILYVNENVVFVCQTFRTVKFY